MSESIITLVSVLFGSILTYLFQLISDSRKRKSELRKEKIDVYQRLIKIDKLYGPNNSSMHAYHFDDQAFIEKVYPVLLDNYFYFPEEVRVKFDEVYNWLKDIELNGISKEFSKKEFNIMLNEAYSEGIQNLQYKLLELIY